MELQGSTTLYLDTEFESTRDGSTLCLLQLSNGGEIYLIDTLRLNAPKLLASILGQPCREWVMHAGQQDLPLILGAAGLARPPLLFDTQVAWALLGPEYSVSLAYLLYRALGIRTQKTHQADDWKRRPLPPAQLDYAASDVEHLPELREVLLERLRRHGREHLVPEVTRELLLAPAEPPLRLSLESFRHAWQLERPSQAALRYLIDWYNDLSEAEKDRAPEPKVLLSIATRLPETPDDLARIKGIPRRWVGEQGASFLSALLRATAAADAGDFVEIEPPPYATIAELRLDGWLAHARAEICAELELAPELAFPNRVLRQMRQLIAASGDYASAVQALAGWREQLLAEAFLRHVRREAPAGDGGSPPGWSPDALSQGDSELPEEVRVRLSHELRNPLSAIASALALLKRPENAGEEARYLSVIERQVGQLAELVDEELAGQRLSEMPAPPSAPVPSYSQLPGSAGLCVLIVDDNEDAASTLGELVTAWGHRVQVAHEGTRALELANLTRPDVVVLDIGLPGMDGYELALKMRERGVQAAFIALTGYGQRADREHAKALGFAAHMVKPVDASALKSAINSVHQGAR